MKKIIYLFFILFFAFAPLHAAYAEDGLIEKGLAEIKKDNYEEAVDYFSRARAQDPRSSLAAFYLGLAYKQSGSYKDAVKQYKDALALTPPVLDSYTELIEVLYNMNELKEAKEWIAAAERAKIKPAQVAFLKGLVFAKEDNNDSAVEAFKSARELDKSLAQAADFQIAMAYAKERRLKEARESLKAVITQNPTSEIASFAKEYEKSIARVIESYKAWHFAVGAAYQYDDNVVSKPTAAIGIPVVDQPVKGKGDSALVNTFRADYTPLLGGPWSFSGQYNIFSTTYFKNYSMDILSHSLSLIPGYNFKKGAVTLPLTYNHVWLNEREYMGVVSAKPTLTAIIAPRHIGQLSVGYGKRDMLRPTTPEEDRDGDIYSIGAGYIYPFSEGKGMFNLRYEYTKENTDGVNWDNSGSRLSAGLLAPLRDKVSLTVSGDATLQYYDHLHTITVSNADAVAIGLLPVPGYPDTPTRRRDKVYTGMVGITWELLNNLNLNVNYSYTRADSNFAIYDYKKNAYMAGLEYSF